MSAKYEGLAQKIVELVGGDENIIGLHHCQTRLRFKLKDSSIANTQALEAMDEVLQVIDKGGMYQVVIGMHVAEVYEECIKFFSVKEENSQVEEKTVKRSLFDTLTDFISSIFTPIIPALAGAGMVKALLALLVAFHMADPSSQLYILLNMIGDATFAFMPILLAYTTAKKLNCNPIMGAVTAAILCHPTWSQLVADGNPVSFAGIPLYLVRYTSSVIPIILVLLVQSPLEKWLNKVVPGAIRLVVVPMIEMIVMGVLALSLIGPIGDFVGSGLTGIFSALSEHAGWLETMLMGGLFAPLVVFGLHHGLAPLGMMQMSQMGYDAIFGPGVLCANIAQGMSSFVAGLTAKDSKTRQIGISAGVTGLLGTTEPALYGINVPKKYPFIAGMIGGAASGLYAGLMHVRRFATGSSGLPAVVMYIGEGTMQYFIHIMIALAIDIVVTTAAVLVLKKIFEKTNEPVAAKVPALEKGQMAVPCAGKIIDKKEIPDPTFASGLMGETIGIIPSEGLITAPFDGTLTMIAPTKHALGLTSNDGLEVLIHVGIDTVYMEGKGFEPLMEAGQSFKAGQPLLKFDIQEIKKAGYSDIVNVILTNSASYENVQINFEGPALLQAA